MRPISFPGRYEDERGAEEIVWRMSSVPGLRGVPVFELRTTIRGAEVWGNDLDGLELADPARAGEFTLDRYGALTDCVTSGDLPCTLAIAGERVPAAVRFTLEVREAEDRPFGLMSLTLQVTAEGRTFTAVDDGFEGGLSALERAFPGHVRLVCCGTCRFGDYNPGGHGTFGVTCFRDAKEQYLAVRTKGDYWEVPVTEEVPETYLCDQYQRREPGAPYGG